MWKSRGQMTCSPLADLANAFVNPFANPVFTDGGTDCIDTVSELAISNTGHKGLTNAPTTGSHNGSVTERPVATPT